MLKDRLNAFVQWLDEEEGVKNNEDEVEISPRTSLIAFVITVLFSSLLFYSEIKSFLSRDNFDLPAYLDSHIEENYFGSMQELGNTDFSEGKNHWATADGGGIFPDSESKMELDGKVYHSALFSLKIESIHPANRLFYTKNKDFFILNNPYNDFKNLSHWFGVKGVENLKVGLWYKGDMVTLYLQGLKKDGQWQGVGKITGEATNEWRKIELENAIPANIRAVAFEITVNRREGLPAPVVYIDDFFVTVQ